MDIFISYNFRDREAVQVIAHSLQQQGLSVFLDRWYLTPGLYWPQALEKALNDCRAVAVLIGPSGLGRWQQQEKNLALDRQSRDPDFPVIPVLLPGADPALGFLSLNTWVDLRAGLTDPLAYTIITAAVRGEPPGPGIQERVMATLATVCPYRGLRPFREEDATFFFGREPYIQVLVDAVEQNSFVAVVGGSGSGKSSVVRAGLVPRMRRGVHGRVWDVVTLVPGDSPHHALADAMLPLVEPEAAGIDRLVKVNELAKHLTAGRVTLSDLVAEALRGQPGTDRLLLVVDQWEELYTSVKDETVRRSFINELLNATTKGQLSVAITIRGDFFGHVLSHRLLVDRLQNTVVNLGPMNREELKRTIVEPANSMSLSFEPGLVERILNDVENEPGNLPLLEFALTELWARRQRGLLSNDAYDEIGGVAGAIAQRAEEEFAKFSPEQQAVAHYIFTSLVRVARPDEGIDDTRQRVILDDLQSSQRSENGREVKDEVKALADARLLVTSRDAATGKVTVEVAHEALIRKWKRLRDWVDKDRDGLRVHNRLRTAAEEWRANKEQSSFLYHGAHLAEALDWARSNEDKLSEDERLFLERSNRRRQAARAGVVAGATIIILAAVVAIFYALRERELKVEIMRNTDELKLQGLLKELRDAWLDERKMQDWLRKAEEFSEPVNRHAGINPQLDQRLRQFRDGATGDMAMARACIERLRALKRKTVKEQKDNWEKVKQEMAETESIYGKLRLNPIEGLVPLKKDPRTQLQEFAVYLTGEIPARGGDGHLVVSDDSALVLVLLPANSFTMGSNNKDNDNEGAPHLVALDAFLISKYEMTQGQWLQATYDNPSFFQHRNTPGAKLTWPVEMISWETAKEVLARIQLTLPTEAQWEYAARAGTEGDWYAGDSEAAWRAGCISRTNDSRQEPCAVDHGIPNAFGLYGIIGNDWEWCLDPECPYDRVKPEGGTGERKCDAVPRAYRGGSFYSKASLARSARRASNPPKYFGSNIGVRPALRLNGLMALSS